MAVALSYDAQLSRVRIAATALVGSFAVFERSTDQVTWTTVRGGAQMPIVGGAASLDDYEFAADVLNYYRVSVVSTSPITFVGLGGGVSANNSSVTSTIPAGVAVGDLVMIFASIRNAGVGSVDVPAGWTPLIAQGNVKILGRIYDGVWTMPLITFSGGVANADTMANSVAFRNAALAPHAAAGMDNGSAQNIAYPGVTVTRDGAAIIYYAWKQDDFTNLQTIPGATVMNRRTSTAGDDAGQGWDYVIQTTATSIPSGSWIVTGGVAAVSKSGVIALQKSDYSTQETQTITPSLAGQTWLKSLIRPFLNRVVEFTGAEPRFVAPSRNGVFDIIGRSVRVAVTDVRASEEFELEAITFGPGERSDLRLMLASGDPLFLHVPADHCVLRSEYVVAGNTDQYRQAPQQSVADTRYLFKIPFVVVAPPGPDVIGATVTWQDIVNNFLTWSSLMAAEPTWNDVVERIGDPSDVVVP